MTPAELYDLLKKAQEPKGYFFNKNKVWVLIHSAGSPGQQGPLRLYILPLPPVIRQSRK